MNKHPGQGGRMGRDYRRKNPMNTGVKIREAVGGGDR